MSGYVHAKVIRCPLSYVKGAINIEKDSEIENTLRYRLGDMWEAYSGKKGFEITCTDKEQYLDWVYFYTYGEESGDFGTARLLTDNEYQSVIPLYDKIGIHVDHFVLRRVEYCYYNCCEPPDYYSVTETDDSGEIKC